MKPVLCWLMLCGITVTAVEPTTWRFDLGSGKATPGWQKVGPQTGFTAARGYGFEPGAEVSAVDRGGSDPLGGDFCTAATPFSFSVAVPEGNYLVKVTLGDLTRATLTTIKSESRQVQALHVATEPGRIRQQTLAINVRTPRLPDQREVAINARERRARRWDGKLTLEFADAYPCVGAIEIVAAPTLPTIYLAGDSTMTDQQDEPYCGWGQLLPLFVGTHAAVANHAESGRAARSFIGERRLDKIRSTMRRGDWLLIQFGHNDQKEKGPGIGAFTSFTRDVRTILAAAAAAGVTPVLVTPMQRRTFGPDGTIQATHGDYPEALRRIAAEDHLALIDLQATSKILYEAMGEGPSKAAFVHFPANTFPGQMQALKDNTHFTSYGAYEIARCVVAGIAASDLPLRQLLVADLLPFSPTRPDPLAAVAIPPSPVAVPEKPEGN